MNCPKFVVIEYFSTYIKVYFKETIYLSYVCNNINRAFNTRKCSLKYCYKNRCFVYCKPLNRHQRQQLPFCFLIHHLNKKIVTPKETSTGQTLKDLLYKHYPEYLI